MEKASRTLLSASGYFQTPGCSVKGLALSTSPCVVPVSGKCALRCRNYLLGGVGSSEKLGSVIKSHNATMWAYINRRQPLHAWEELPLLLDECCQSL